MATPRRDLVTVCLRGAGQVFFMENALTGAFFLAAIAYASHATGTWAILAGALLGLVVSTLTARLLDYDCKTIDAGLFGFNGILVGVAVPSSLAITPQLWVCVVVGAAASTVFASAFSATLTRQWGIPASTGPFVLTGWLIVAAAYSFGGLKVAAGAPEFATDYLRGVSAIPAPMEFGRILLRNIGQVFLLGSEVSGALVLAGILVASVPAGIAALTGSGVATLVAVGMGADPVLVSQGLYGFSAVLTAIAVGVVFFPPSVKGALYALLATVVTVFVEGALNVMVAPDGIPSFTAPYVLTMYLFVAAASASGGDGNRGAVDTDAGAV